MPTLRSVLTSALAVGALAVAAPTAGADVEFGFFARSPQGGVAFRVHNDGTRVYTYGFHFVTRCGTTWVPGHLVWGQSVPEFRYVSPDGHLKIYAYVDTSPRGNVDGFVRDRRSNGCFSGKLPFHGKQVGPVTGSFDSRATAARD